MNYSVKGTPLTGNGSDLKPDASVGVQLYNPLFHVGFSVRQVFNSEVRPLEEITILAPVANILADVNLNTSEWLVLKSAISFHFPLTKHEKRYNRNYYDAALLFIIQQKMTFSAGVHSNDRLVLSAGLNNLLSASGNLNIFLSYSFVFKKNTNLSSPLLELGVNYLF